MTKISALSDIGTSVASNDAFVLVDVSDPTTPNKKIQQQNLFLIPDGSAGTPAVRFLNDTDVGLFRPTTNTLALATGGSERLRITSTGTVNIVGAGTGGSTQAVSFNGSAPVDSLVLTSGGLVGVGTSDPSTILTIQKNIDSSAYGSGTQVIDFKTPYPGFDVGTIKSSIYSGVSSQTPLATNKGYLAFLTHNGTSLTETLRIESNGSVGIGTQTPSQLLTLQQTSAGAAVDCLFLNNSSVSANTSVGISFGPNVSNTVNRSAVIRGINESGGSGNATGLQFLTNANGASPTEKARIDSSGRLLVGTSTARSNVYYGTNQITPTHQYEFNLNSYNTGISLINYNYTGYAPVLTLGLSQSATQGTNTALAGPDTDLGIINFTGNDGTNFRTGASIVATTDAAVSTGDLPTRLVFSTTADGADSPTERMRIQQNGNVKIGETTLTTRQFSVRDINTNTVVIGADSTQSSGTGWYLFYGISGGSQLEAWIRGDGTYGSRTNVYGSTSDIKIKENVVDAQSQWEDLKAIEVKNFNLIGDTSKQLGVIAQQVEQICPGLVDETPDRDEEGTDLGTVTKSVKYSVLYMKAVKALQEAIGRIETLEAEVAALKAQ